MKTFASSSDVSALIAKAKSERKQDQPTFAQPIVQLAPYNASLEYRAAVGPAAVHEKDAELFYVIDGSGTLVTGGKLVNEKRNNPENLDGPRGAALDAGAAKVLRIVALLVHPGDRRKTGEREAQQSGEPWRHRHRGRLLAVRRQR